MHAIASTRTPDERAAIARNPSPAARKCEKIDTRRESFRRSAGGGILPDHLAAIDASMSGPVALA